MKISTEINSIAKIVGEEEAVRLVAEAGFDAFDFSMFNMVRYDWHNRCVVPTDHPLSKDNYLEFAKKIKAIGLEYGITCNQSHAPFPVSCPEIRNCLKRAIECTAEAGGNICIIHPDNYKTAQENAEMYFELLPFAKDHGVRIATENMWNWDSSLGHATPAACSSHQDFLAHLELVNDPYFVACLDIGHAEMRGLNTTAVEMIHTLGHHIQALHLHDNDLLHDSHKLPMTMDIDFTAVVKALKDIGYNGFLTLEADTHCNGCSPEELPERVAEMAHCARQLDTMFG